MDTQNSTIMMDPENKDKVQELLFERSNEDRISQTSTDRDG